MSHTVELKCSCGSVKGSLKVVPRSYFHAHCLCIDCQNFARHLDNEKNILDEHGGSEVFQTYPSYLKISEGHEHIGCIKFAPKGLLRWHTQCCNMPLANTMGSSGIPFVGVSVKLMKFSGEQEKLDILGPVTLKAFGKYAIGEMPRDAHERFPRSFMLKIMGFMLKGLLLRKNTPSPFFKGKEPTVVAELVP